MSANLDSSARRGSDRLALTVICCVVALAVIYFISLYLLTTG